MNHLLHLWRSQFESYRERCGGNWLSIDNGWWYQPRGDLQTIMADLQRKYPPNTRVHFQKWVTRETDEDVA